MAKTKKENKTKSKTLTTKKLEVKRPEPQKSLTGISVARREILRNIIKGK